MMDSKWRPTGWENPYREFGLDIERLEREPISFGVLTEKESREADKHIVYEEGASAIIPAVREATLKEVVKDLRSILKEANDLKELERLLVSYVGEMPKEVKDV